MWLGTAPSTNQVDTTVCPPQVFTFSQAVQAAKDGASISRVTSGLLAQLTKSERLALLDGDTPFWDGLRTILCDRYNRVPFVHGRIDRLGIPGIRFSDGPRGVVMGQSTAFPVSMARGATWDVGLERQVGEAIGKEAKAQGANFFGGVCINLPRHPAWGRIQETYGEDPILLGEFGLALTQGVQKYVMACVKHFALNSMENARFRVDVDVDDDILHEVYLPHFRRVVEGGVASVMSSYNALRGQWCGQSSELLNDILRSEWKFTGFVLSDFVFGLRDPVLSLKNGLDIEAPFSQQRSRSLVEALQKGDLTWSHVDKACSRILAQQLIAATSSRGAGFEGTVFSEQHRRLSHEVAARSMTLLKNDLVAGAPLLPIDTTKVRKIALVGRLCNVANTGDRGSSRVFPPHVVTFYEGLCAAMSGVEISLEDTGDVERAKVAAVGADIVICVVGYDWRDEGEYVVPSLQQDSDLQSLLPPTVTANDEEMLRIVLGQESPSTDSAALEVGAGGDRKSVRLRPHDVNLISTITKANQNTIACVVAAGAVIMEEWKSKVPALLLCWYSGSEGGHALADVLLGHTDASGRLPFSIPQDESHLPYFDAEARRIHYDRWYGQHLLDQLGVEAAFPFGFGLSYTQFVLSDIRFYPSYLEQDPESIVLSVNVSNTGTRKGRHIVQVYCVSSLPDFPSRVLLGFVPVDCDVGESKDTMVFASSRPLQRWKNGHFVLAQETVVLEIASYAGDPNALQRTCTLR